MKTTRTAAFILLAALVIAVFSVPACGDGGEAPSELLATLDSYVFFINVGRGDAILIKSGDTFALIDTGDAEHSDRLLSALSACGVDSLDAVFITHGNDDHMGALEIVAEKYGIGTFYYPKYSEEDKKGKNKLKKKAQKLSLSYDGISAGDEVTVGSLTFEVYAPIALSETEENDNSLVMKTVIGGIAYLFTGDIEFLSEAAVVSSGVSLDADVLKVPNHGNPDATSREFVDLVSPKVSVVCTSKKEDGNSAATRVLDALAVHGSYYITEDAETGILVYMREDDINVSYVGYIGNSN